MSPATRDSTKHLPKVDRRQGFAPVRHIGSVDLATGGAGDLIQEVPALRHLMLCQMMPEPFVEFANALVAGPFQDECDTDVFPLEGVLVAERADVDRLVEPLRNAVDGGGMNLHPPFVDLVPLASPQVEPAAIVDGADIACEKPSLGDDLPGQILPTKVSAHQRRRVDPDISRLAPRAFLRLPRGDLRVRSLEDPDHRSPRLADQAVLRSEVRYRGSRHPAAGLRDSVGIEDLPRPRPFLDFLPEEGRERRGAAEHPLQLARTRRGGSLQCQAPEGRDRGHEGHPVLVEQRSQLKNQIGSEGRKDEEILAREPWKEAVADQPVAEVRRKQAKGSTKFFHAETLAESHPASPKGPMGVDNPLGLSGGAGSEQ